MEVEAQADEWIATEDHRAIGTTAGQETSGVGHHHRAVVTGAVAGMIDMMADAEGIAHLHHMVHAIDSAIRHTMSSTYHSVPLIKYRTFRFLSSIRLISEYMHIQT
jgi:hypothetical protein